jgi:predicted N-formylglutamate amidohydrolase
VAQPYICGRTRVGRCFFISAEVGGDAAYNGTGRSISFGTAPSLPQSGRNDRQLTKGLHALEKQPHTVLATDEPPAFEVTQENGTAPFVIVADHAGRRIPRSLGQLGLAAGDCERHIAWDIGAGLVSLRVGQELAATVIRQTYSRLVIDCNRTPGTPQSILAVSESTCVPGNASLSEAARSSRLREIFEPYHTCITGELDRRATALQNTVLISIHSFTPVYLALARPWHVGVLYNRDPRLAHRLMQLLRSEPGLVVGDNEPYSVGDETDYTIPVHGEQRGLPHVAIEIRQDLITAAAGQEKFAMLLARLLPQALEPL